MSQFFSRIASFYWENEAEKFIEKLKKSGIQIIKKIEPDDFDGETDMFVIFATNEKKAKNLYEEFLEEQVKSE